MAVPSVSSRNPVPAAKPGRAAFWNDPAIRGIVYQILFVALVIALGWYLVHNTLENLRRQNIATGFSFLEREAAFAIGETPIPYTPADTYLRAFLVGLINTLEVAALGIVLATVLGTLIGIGRLSTNWLIRKLTLVYVDTFRNIPLPLQLLVWWGLLREGAPGPRVAWNPLPDIFVSNRGVTFPTPSYEAVHPWMAAALLIGVVLSVLTARWARTRQAATGAQFPVLWASFGWIIGLPLIVFLIAGAPWALDRPELKGFNFSGGHNISPEFAALLFGLTVYTASFIAEIVRAGIQSVSWGQSEAAMALGLRSSYSMRLVVLPQALRVIIPPMTSQYLNLTKNSSLAVIIGYPDLVSIANTTINQTGQAIEGITMIMAVYLVISLTISLLMNLYNGAVRLRER